MNKLGFDVARALSPGRFSIALLLLCACNDAGSSSGAVTTSGSGAVTASGSADTSAGADAPRPGAIGIAACDAYVKRMRACIEKAPEAERAPRVKSIDEIEKTWVAQAGTSDGKTRTEGACAAALKALDETSDCK